MSEVRFRSCSLKNANKSAAKTQAILADVSFSIFPNSFHIHMSSVKKLQISNPQSRRLGNIKSCLVEKKRKIQGGVHILADQKMVKKGGLNFSYVQNSLLS